MNKIKWSLELWFILSAIIFGIILFSYSKTIIQYFLDRNGIFFFISDFNLFTHIYIYNNRFIVYVVYSPFFYCRFFLWLIKFVFKSTYRVYVRIILALGYTHILARILNHIDFADISIISLATLFDSKVDIIDFSYRLRHYYGLYWDFFTIICFYMGRNRYFVENATKFVYCSTGYRINKINQFWSVFYFSWLIRGFIFRLINYFFCGEGFFSDRMVCRLSLIGIEFLRFTWRMNFLLSRIRN